MGRNRRRARVGRRSSHSGDVDGGCVSGDGHNPGSSGARRRGSHRDRLRDRLRDRPSARHSVVPVVGTGAEGDVWTARNTDVKTSAGIVLAAGTRAAGSVMLAVSSGAEGDVWTAGDADIETGAGVLLTVAVGRSGVGVATT